MKQRNNKLKTKRKENKDMGFGVSKDELEGNKPIPGNTYQLQVSGFKPKMSKAGDSVNLNPVLKVVNSSEPKYNGQRIFFNLNTKAPWIMQDFAHSAGLPMEMHKTGANGEEEAHLPGGPNAFREDPSGDVSKAVYTGPLLGKIIKAEVIEEQQAGQKPRNSIKQFICAIDGCATKYPDINHSNNLIKQL